MEQLILRKTGLSNIISGTLDIEGSPVIACVLIDLNPILVYGGHTGWGDGDTKVLPRVRRDHTICFSVLHVTAPMDSKNQVIAFTVSSQRDVIARIAITKVEELLIVGVIRRVNPDTGTEPIVKVAQACAR